MTKTFWIQQQAPAGNYYDRVGFAPRTTKRYAIRRLLAWRKAFPTDHARLIQRHDRVIVK